MDKEKPSSEPALNFSSVSAPPAISAATPALTLSAQPPPLPSLQLTSTIATTSVQEDASAGSKTSVNSGVAKLASNPQTAAAGSVPVTSSAAIQPQPPRISFAQLEDMLNKWTSELGDQERLFLNQATQINAWDNLLGANCLKLTSLDESVRKVKTQQQRINHDLDFILSQQKELDASLTPLEKEYTASIYTNDVQRERMYFMAENIDSQLKHMSEDLKETIDHINETSRSTETVDPVVQIGRILNAHMNSLQWIDENTSKLQTQLENINKIHENYKRESDRRNFSYY